MTPGFFYLRGTRPICCKGVNCTRLWHEGFVLFSGTMKAEEDKIFVLGGLFRYIKSVQM